MLEEHNCLKDLSKIDNNKLNVPKTHGFSKEYNAYFMDLVEGVSINDLIKKHKKT